MLVFCRISTTPLDVADFFFLTSFDPADLFCGVLVSSDDLVARRWLDTEGLVSSCCVDVVRDVPDVVFFDVALYLFR